jgi:hypothetical protein
MCQLEVRNVGAYDGLPFHARALSFLSRRSLVTDPQKTKNPLPIGRGFSGLTQGVSQLAIDGRSAQGNRSSFTSRQVKREVVSIALVHHFHTQVGAVDHISPGVDHAALAIQHRLVEVEAVQVKRHRADAQGRKPDANHRPSSQEEMQTAAVVEAGVSC